MLPLDVHAVEARSLLALLAARGDAQVHRRYDRWWANLPCAEVLLLPSD